MNIVFINSFCLKFLLIFFAFWSGLSSANVIIEASPGDTFNAFFDQQYNKTNVYSNHSGVCLGFGNFRNTAFWSAPCPLPSKVTDPNGIIAEMFNADASAYTTTPWSSVSINILNGRKDFCTTGATCGDNYAVDPLNTPGGKYYNVSTNISFVRFTLPSTLAPGRYRKKLTLGVISDDWWNQVGNQDIQIVVRNNTCTLTDQSIDMGKIPMRGSTTRPFDLDLTCTDGDSTRSKLPHGASLVYQNLSNSGENTNLSNVDIILKDSSGSKIYPLDPFTDFKGLQIQVKAKDRAELGTLQVRLAFTLTYS
ncbi:fimbrial protein [Vibrio splendidus]|uniref:fimbrial protein n=1 Tax=Vibrio splendidus TaxID=29497 RepID=UPI000769F18D|nr:fimbrial protein [Vibrio splendidus]